MTDHYFEATSSTILRYLARISSRVLSELDTAAPTYFDDAFEESTTLQNRIEATLRVVLLEFADELTEARENPPHSREDRL